MVLPCSWTLLLGSHLEAKTPITPAMFEPYAAAFQPGAKIIYRTGWDRAFGTPEYFSDFPVADGRGARGGWPNGKSA